MKLGRSPLPLVAALVLGGLLPARAAAEEGPRMVPVLSLHLAPAMSVVMPIGAAGAVTETYGLVHPGGTLGLCLRLTESFALAVDVEAEGWYGQLELPGDSPLDIRFLSYWLHVRTRTRLAHAGPLSVELDAGLALIFSREDAQMFRGEGAGFGIDAGPRLAVALGQWIDLSFGVLLEAAWVFYGVESPLGGTAPRDYTLPWPRVLFELGVSGHVIHRAARDHAPPAEPPEAAAPAEAPSTEAGEPAPEAAAPTVEPAPEAAAPELVPQPAPQPMPESPFDE